MLLVERHTASALCPHLDCFNGFSGRCVVLKVSQFPSVHIISLTVVDHDKTLADLTLQHIATRLPFTAHTPAAQCPVGYALQPRDFDKRSLAQKQLEHVSTSSAL